MGFLNKNVLDEILIDFNANLNSFPIFIETGTHLGKTIKEINSLFKEIHTIEISNIFFDKAAKNLSTFSNVNLHLGDSSIVLQDILKNCNENIIFWLDGHFSGGDTGKGEKDCPVIEECITISEYLLRTKTKAIILIDDFRLFGKNQNQDWTNITKEIILSKFTTKILFESVSKKRDMYQIFASGE